MDLGSWGLPSLEDLVRDAIFGNDIGSLSKLLQRKDIDLNQFDSTGSFNPLFLGISYGRNEVVEMLLNDKRVLLNVSNSTGQTPLSYSSGLGAMDILLMLLQHPQSDDKLVNFTEGYVLTPLMNACKYGQLNCLKVLLGCGKVNVNVQLKTGETALYFACLNGDVNLVGELLKDSRVDVNLARKDKRTPLYLACEQRNFLVVRELIQDPRTDPNISNEDFQTPLLHASFYGYIEVIVELLKSQKIDIGKVDSYGFDSLSLALNQGHHHIVNYISNISSNSNLNSNSNSMDSM